MLTTAGSGYSRCEGNAVTRWREDVTRDNWGAFIYLRDVRSGAVWSAGHQPVRRRPQSYHVAFSEDKADFRRLDSGISTRMEVVVSAEDNAEVRRISLTNHSSRTREIELTSYAEVVLNTPDADAAHQAFSNLFVETEFFAGENAILAHRRQRSSEDKPIWGVHVVVAEGDLVGAVQYETDRGRFLGRGRTAEQSDRGHGRSPAFKHDRRRARSGFQSATARENSSRIKRCGLRSARPSRNRAKRRWRWPTSITIRISSSASCAWRGPRRKSR